MSVIDLDDARDAPSLNELAEQVLAGEEVVLVRGGQPVVKLTELKEDEEQGVKSPPKRRTGGYWEGRVRIGDDFDDPLPKEIAEAFGMPTE